MQRMMVSVIAAVLLVVSCGKPVKQGGECKIDEDCRLGQVCQEAGKFCITATCEFCTEGQVCYKPTPDSEGSCSAPPDCEAGECDDMGTPDMGDESDVSTDAPCASLERQTVSFGGVAVGDNATEIVSVENCSSATTLTVEPTGLGPFSAPGLEIPPRSSADYEIVFTPSDVGFFSSELLLATNAGGFRVAVSGEGVEDGELCPIPVIENGGARAFVVGTMVTLSAATSQARQGEIVGYEWTVVDRPAGSTSMLTTPMAETTSLTLDTLGDYTVELNVTDSFGTAGCAPTRVTLSSLESVPNRFRIVLTWATPNDPDETDINGADVDLHYLNPTGMWNQPPGDIFWNNVTADWAGEDPQLTIDDTDGAGPEEIVHNAPRSDVDYRIGVYYYADNGFGPSYATVQVYVNGVLTFEVEDEYLASQGKFWGPTLLNGLTDAVSADTAVTGEGFP